MAIDRDNSELQ